MTLVARQVTSQSTTIRQSMLREQIQLSMDRRLSKVLGVTSIKGVIVKQQMVEP
jgi:hypothetical protein